MIRELTFCRQTIQTCSTDSTYIVGHSTTNEPSIYVGRFTQTVPSEHWPEAERDKGNRHERRKLAALLRKKRKAQ